MKLSFAGSAVYTGWVRHRRFIEPRRVFRYPVALALLDLEDVTDLSRRLRLFGHNRPAPVTFRDRDHLLGQERPVREQLDEVLSERASGLPSGPVLLLTSLRTLGSLFNPVSLYYCWDEALLLRYVVAEVNNTFGDRFCYVLDELAPSGGSAVRSHAAKVFHVSPFQQVGGAYEFTVGLPGDQLVVHIAHRRESGPALDATLSLRRRPFNSRSLLRTLGLSPLTGVRTLTLIHWQALRLWLGRAPFHSRPLPPPDALRVRR